MFNYNKKQTPCENQRGIGNYGGGIPNLIQTSEKLYRAQGVHTSYCMPLWLLNSKIKMFPFNLYVVVFFFKKLLSC